MPRRASSSTRSAVNGRAALGISALPGSVPKICWYARTASCPVHGGTGWARRGARGSRSPARRDAVTRARAAASREGGPAWSGGRRRRAARSTPVRSSVSGTVLGPSGRRPSTSQKPPGISVEKCTRTAAPSGRVPAIAAGMVAEVFTTTTSPRRSYPGRSENVACTTSCVAVRDEQPDIAAAPAPQLGRLVGLERRVERLRPAPTAPARRS